MARPCSICGSERRSEIDDALRTNVPYEAIGARFQVALMSILSHRHHLDALGGPGTGPDPTFATSEAGVDTSLDQLQALCEKFLALLQTAEATSEPRAISLALVQVRRNLKAFADLTEQVRRATRPGTRPASRAVKDGVAPAPR